MLKRGRALLACRQTPTDASRPAPPASAKFGRAGDVIRARGRRCHAETTFGQIPSSEQGARVEVFLGCTPHPRPAESLGRPELPG